MADVFSAIMATLVVLVLTAAAIYIGSFLISMLVAMFAAAGDALTHHHHGRWQTG